MSNAMEPGLADAARGRVADIGYAKLDLSRVERQGAGEVVYGEGKTAAQIAGIIDALVAAGQPRVLATRVDADKAVAVTASVPCGVDVAYHETAPDPRRPAASPSPTGTGTCSWRAPARATCRSPRRRRSPPSSSETA